MSTISTTYVMINENLNLVLSEAVAIHNVTADAMDVKTIDDGNHEAFTSITFAAENGFRNRLFISGTPSQRADTLRQIAYALSVAAEEV